MDADFINARITATKALIVKYEDALLALGNGILSYTLDTGQNRQTVTNADIGDMNKIIDSLYNRCGNLEAQLTGSGSVTVGPCW